jgi:hypothetical protein
MEVIATAQGHERARIGELGCVALDIYLVRIDDRHIRTLALFAQIGAESRDARTRVRPSQVVMVQREDELLLPLLGGGLKASKNQKHRAVSSSFATCSPPLHPRYYQCRWLWGERGNARLAHVSPDQIVAQRVGLGDKGKCASQVAFDVLGHLSRQPVDECVDRGLFRGRDVKRRLP